MVSRKIIIGIVVVVVLVFGPVIYNWTVTRTRGPDPAREKVAAFRYARNIEAGDTITNEDLIRVEIPKNFAECIGRLLKKDDKDALAVDRIINRDVSKDDFAMMGHFTTRHPPPGYTLPEDRVLVSIVVDGRPPMGRALRVGNHVNILGMLPAKDGSYKVFRIMEWLKVAAISHIIDHVHCSGDRSNTAKCRMPRHIVITVEMKCRNPDVSLQWSNLRTYLKGVASYEICPSRFTPNMHGTGGKIADRLLPFTTKPAVVPTDGPEDSRRL